MINFRTVIWLSFWRMKKLFEIKPPFEIKVVTVPWIDTPQQVLDKTTFEQALLSTFQYQYNVLVHCSQGKSRSGVICIGFLALIKPTVAIEDLAKEVKSRRGIAPKTSKLRTSILVYDSLPEIYCDKNFDFLELFQSITKEFLFVI